MQNIEVFPEFEVRKEQLDQQAKTQGVMAAY
jgi:hypothetical protein